MRSGIGSVIQNVRGSDSLRIRGSRTLRGSGSGNLRKDWNMKGRKFIITIINNK